MEITVIPTTIFLQQTYAHQPLAGLEVVAQAARLAEPRFVSAFRQLQSVIAGAPILISPDGRAQRGMANPMELPFVREYYERGLSEGLMEADIARAEGHFQTATPALDKRLESAAYL